MPGNWGEADDKGLLSISLNYLMSSRPVKDWPQKSKTKVGGTCCTGLFSKSDRHHLPKFSWAHLPKSIHHSWGCWLFTPFATHPRQLLPAYTWPWGRAQVYRPENLEGLHLCSYGQAFIHTGWRSSSMALGGCTFILRNNLPPILCK